MKKYKNIIIVVSVMALLILGFVANAQGGKFFRFAGLPEVYKWMSSPQEFIAEGGDWNEIQNFGEPSFGSVGVTNEYTATTTDAFVAGKKKLIKTGVSTLGSIIVSSSSGSTFKVYNATSTTDTASTTIATFKASIGEGTYTFDAELNRGLSIEAPDSFNGFYVITYR